MNIFSINGTTHEGNWSVAEQLETSMSRISEAKAAAIRQGQTHFTIKGVTVEIIEESKHITRRRPMPDLPTTTYTRYMRGSIDVILRYRLIKEDYVLIETTCFKKWKQKNRNTRVNTIMNINL